MLIFHNDVVMIGGLLYSYNVLALYLRTANF